MTPERIAEIKQRCEAAQRGDWFCDGYDIWHKGQSYESKDDPHFYTGISIDPKLTKSPKALANLTFCAHARADIPALLTAVETLQQDNARLRAALEWIETYSQDKKHYWGIHKVSSEALKDTTAIDAALEDAR
jgi:hypothetical protein